MRIIGIDPGLTKTGFGIVDAINNNLKFVGSGTIHTNACDKISVRLKKLHDELIIALQLYNPDAAAIEETFINNNPLSSLKLGHARGSLILTLGIFNLEVFEYSTTAGIPGGI